MAWVIFKPLLLCWVPGREPPKGDILIPYSSMVVPRHNKPFGFQSQMFWGLVSLGQVPGVKGLMSIAPCSSGRSPIFMRSFLIVGCLARGGIWDCVSDSPAHLSVTLLSFVVEGLLS